MIHSILLDLSLVDFLGTTTGIYLLQSRNFDRRFIAISGGVMFGAGTFWMWSDIAQGLGVAGALLAISAGVVTLYIVDRFFYPVCPCCQHDRRHSYRISPLALIPLAIAIAVHNFFDGWVAGVAANLGAVARSEISTGLISHKVPEAVLFGMTLRSATNEVRDAIVCAIITASVILLGGVCHGKLPSATPRTLTISLALTSASFLFFGGHIFWRQRELLGTRSAMLYLALGTAGTLALSQATVIFR